MHEDALHFSCCPMCCACYADFFNACSCSLWQVNEQPGTYFWHGHAGNEKVDGFTGPLIVRPAGPEPFTYDEERVLFLSDNYHTSATALTFPLNRCADAVIAQGSLTLMAASNVPSVPSEVHLEPVIRLYRHEGILSMCCGCDQAV